MLMIDRIIEINNTGRAQGLGQIIAEIDINPDLWFLIAILRRPCDVGCLGLDALWQLIGFWSGTEIGRGRALGAGNIKFLDNFAKCKKVVYKLDITSLYSANLLWV